MTLSSTSDAVRRPRVDTVTSRLRALIAEERAAVATACRRRRS